jgi:hypothetical protein
MAYLSISSRQLKFSLPGALQAFRRKFGQERIQAVDMVQYRLYLGARLL